ncbi:MAG: hypothetical protein CMD28_03745 [Flavobacteriales bacterium]|nr:hypothetical protein [Flavobacteriales bacterium]
MALASRQDLQDYSLRRLGHPVIEINVEDGQVSDRIDDALQFFQEYHFDGVERVFVSHQIVGSKLKLTTNIAGNFTKGEIITGGTSGATAKVDSTDGQYITTEESKGTFVASETITGGTSGSTATLSPTDFYTKGDIENGYVPVGSGILGVTRMFNFGGAATNNTRDGQLFDLMYQFRMNDLYNLMGADMVYYTIVQSHLTTLEKLLTSERQIRFNRKTDRLYVDTDWDKTFNVGDYIVAEAYAIIDPATYTEVYDDMFLKKYTTALIKRQWGENPKKFAGIQMPGGVTLNGDQIYQEAVQEIQAIEQEMSLKYELPPSFMIG